MMKNKFTLILLFFSTLLFSQNSVFWKVKKDGNEGYILGTYHFLGRNFLTENKIILERYPLNHTTFYPTEYTVSSNGLY